MTGSVLGCLRTGPRRYDLSRELGFERPAQVGATPFADSPALHLGQVLRSGFDKKKKIVKLINNGHESVTHVLTHKRYLCPDRTPHAPICHLPFGICHFTLPACADAPSCSMPLG